MSYKDLIKSGADATDIQQYLVDGEMTAITTLFAISPVPVATSSTVFAFTTGRISPYIFSYAARSFRMKRSYRPAFLSQKPLRSCIAIAPNQLEPSNCSA